MTKIKRADGGNIVVKRKWWLWRPIVFRKMIDSASHAADHSHDPEYKEAEKEGGAIGVLIELIISLIPLVFVMVLSAIEITIQLLLMPFIFLWREIVTRWRIEAYAPAGTTDDGKPKTSMMYWEKEGFLASGRLKKEIVKKMKEEQAGKQKKQARQAFGNAFG